MRALFSPSLPVRARSPGSLFGLRARQRLDVADPGRGRAAPDLSRGPELGALADAAPPYSPIVRPALATREQRRAAFVAEMLKPGEAVVAPLRVEPGRLAGQSHLVGRADHRHAERR